PVVVSTTTGYVQSGSLTISPLTWPLKSWAVPAIGGGNWRRRQAALTAAWSRTSVLMVTTWDKVESPVKVQVLSPDPYMYDVNLIQIEPTGQSRWLGSSFAGSSHRVGADQWRGRTSERT